mmetsp:Transcript_4703/g.11537  ORF Transcript_4703/g.11537 Transcript_4703/m.11537 type:complete len:562 (+) Transcript_4703:154-1839(+)|eukprot:CAMPEP_0178991036 /NCGR_PEP_ID=MMETSP0795-20121207/5299_1 /TAXON_ID=88552 /ORGANISM="Amoebophrya sp., Strain Ameob2" /LENGTH=561 /DNA_ID=CAMNT_0020682689 /DNA_START=176 /DNA_END=1861 /DNA_ORIENTATION=-
MGGWDENNDSWGNHGNSSSSWGKDDDWQKDQDGYWKKDDDWKKDSDWKSNDDWNKNDSSWKNDSAGKNDDNWNKNKEDGGWAGAGGSSGSSRDNFEKTEYAEKKMPEGEEWKRDTDADKEDPDKFETADETYACTDEWHILANPVGTTPEVWDTFDKVRQGMPAGLVDMLTDGKVAAFERPTTIQSLVWPVLMSVHDLIGVAKTGSGKTLAFLLPIFVNFKMEEVMSERPPASGEPWGLVLAPTRELCIQIFEETIKFGKEADIRAAVAYGGQNNRNQQKWELQNKVPHIVVACPGRMRDFVYDDRERIVSLAAIKTFILDEADRMLDMGFEWELREIMNKMPADRQSLLFSATFPESVRILAKTVTYRDAFHIQVGSKDPLTGNKDVTQKVMFPSSMRDKDNMLYDVIKTALADDPSSKFLVFCKSKRSCSEMASSFGKWNLSSTELHGDLSQGNREWNLDLFKKGEAKVLFATDVCSRGLDVEGITHVINFAVADSKETHTHRIGRTGRAGKKGIAITFLLPDELGFTRGIVQTMKKAGQEVDPETLAIARENKNTWGW